MGLLYKGLSVWVQSRLDPCPNDTIRWNECVASPYPTYVMHYYAASQYYACTCGPLLPTE